MSILIRIPALHRRTARASTRTSVAFALVVGATLMMPSRTVDAQDRTDTDETSTLTTLPLEALLDLDVFSASRFSQKSSHAPAAVRVITAAEIRDFGWTTLAEALGSLPGLYTSYDRSYAYLGARGILPPGDYGTRFLLLIDGLRINDPVYDQTAVGTDFPVDLDLVDRIEYVPGPGSSSYGSNALLGVINVITKSGADYRGPEAAAEVGSYGRRSLAGRYAWHGDRGDLLVALRDRRIDGADQYYREFDTPDTNDGVARDLDYDRSRLLFVKGSFDRWRVSLAHATRDKGDPTASYEQSFGDPRSRNHDERTFLDVAYSATVSDHVDVSGHAFTAYYAYDGLFAFDPALNIDRGRGAWSGIGAQVVTTAWTRHKIAVGVDGWYDSKRNLSNHDETPFVPHIDFDGTNRHVGMFVEDEFTLRENLRVNTGLRFDDDHIHGSHFSPRLAVIYDASADTTLKAVLGTAYRSPNVYETVSYDSIGQPPLQLGPERIRTAEFVLSTKLGESGHVGLSVFRYQLKDLITQTAENPDGTFNFENGAGAETRGVELSIDHQWERGAVARASYSFTDADDASGNTLPNSPRHIAKFTFATPLPWDALRAGVEGRYVSAREGVYGPVAGYGTLDTTLRWANAAPGLDLSFTVRNVFDKRYSDPAGSAFVQNAIEQDGRTLLLRADYAF